MQPPHFDKEVRELFRWGLPGDHTGDPRHQNAADGCGEARHIGIEAGAHIINGYCSRAHRPADDELIRRPVEDVHHAAEESKRGKYKDLPQKTGAAPPEPGPDVQAAHRINGIGRVRDQIEQGSRGHQAHRGKSSVQHGQIQAWRRHRGEDIDQAVEEVPLVDHRKGGEHAERQEHCGVRRHQPHQYFELVHFRRRQRPAVALQMA